MTRKFYIIIGIISSIGLGILLIILAFVNTYPKKNNEKRLDSLATNASQSKLSNRYINSIVQDQQGFIWQATWDGLSRYDGYENINYQPDLKNPGCFKGRGVRSLFVSQKGELWVGSMKEGLHKYLPEINCFRQYLPQKNNLKSLSSRDITHIWDDNHQNIWVASHTGDINKGIRVSEYSDSLQFESYPLSLEHNTKEDQYLKDVNILTTYQNQNEVWIGTTRGLFKMDMQNPGIPYQKGNYIHYNLAPEKSGKSLYSPYNTIKSLEMENNTNSSEKILWIGTDNGLVKMEFLRNKTKPKLTHIPLKWEERDIHPILSLCHTHTKNQDYIWIGGNEGLYHLHKKTLQISRELIPRTITKIKDKIMSLYEDRAGILWIGTNRGLKYLDQFQKKFFHLKSNEKAQVSISNNDIKRMTEDKNGDIWVTTYGGGIQRIRMQKKTNLPIQVNTYHLIEKNKTLSSDFAQKPEADSSGMIWVGTKGAGVFKFSHEDITEDATEINPIEQYIMNSTKKDALADNYIQDILCDRQGNVWIATYGFGISRYNPKENNFVNYKKVKSEKGMFDLTGVPMIVLHEDKKGYIWIGTQGRGAYCFKPNPLNKATEEIFQRYTVEENNLLDNYIFDIYEDQQHRVWIGTTTGLCFIDAQRKNSIPVIQDSEIVSIEGDNKEGFWLGTKRGVLHLIEKKGKWHRQRYNVEDGIQDDSFNKASAFFSSQGILFMGGTNGLSIFDPTEIHPNEFVPGVAFTSIKVNHKNIYLKHSGDTAKIPTIQLDHTAKTLAFEFTGIHFAAPEKNKYAYKMDGFDEHWIYTPSTKRYAIYTSLPAGEYTLRVKAANSDGKWNHKGIRIHIIKYPPWWDTWWLKLLLFILFGGVIIAIFQVRLIVIQKQKERLENVVQNRTYQLHKKNDEVQQQAEELQQQAEELRTQRDFINNKNRQIEQSIKAARTIQSAVLPYDRKLEAVFQQYFILNRPKDVVSGDFYWLNKQQNKTVIVAADCTGHGVPGAFMTLIGHTLLDKIINVWTCTNPATILEKLHEEVKVMLRQEDTKNDYGMDIIVLTLEEIDEHHSKIIFSGAKNSMYYIPANTKEVQVLKGDRKAIGGVQNKNKSFGNQEVVLSKGTCIYIGSDGFMDQNNQKRKKIGEKKFINLLQQYCLLSFAEQEVKLEQALDEHMKGTTQRDDILLLGFQI